MFPQCHSGVRQTGSALLCSGLLCLMSHKERSQGFFCMPQPGQLAMCDRQNTSRVLPGRTRMSSAPEISLDKELKSQDTVSKPRRGHSHCAERFPGRYETLATRGIDAPTSLVTAGRAVWATFSGTQRTPRRRTPTTRTARSAPAAAARSTPLPHSRSVPTAGPWRTKYQHAHL
jgi:hypothetical protein